MSSHFIGLDRTHTCSYGDQEWAIIAHLGDDLMIARPGHDAHWVPIKDVQYSGRQNQASIPSYSMWS